MADIVDIKLLICGLVKSRRKVFVSTSRFPLNLLQMGADETQVFDLFYRLTKRLYKRLYLVRVHHRLFGQELKLGHLPTHFLFGGISQDMSLNLL